VNLKLFDSYVRSESYIVVARITGVACIIVGLLLFIRYYKKVTAIPCKICYLDALHHGGYYRRLITKVLSPIHQRKGKTGVALCLSTKSF
jgi:hypothetical protein